MFNGLKLGSPLGSVTTDLVAKRPPLLLSMTSPLRPGHLAGGTTMTESAPLARLNASAPAVLPSMLQCDFGNLEREVHLLEAAGVPGLHLDVITTLPLDVHLMMVGPDRYLTQFRDAGADTLTIHVEASRDPAGDLRKIRELGISAGLTLNPSTPMTAIEPYLDHCDLILVMSVEAGFGGQKFNPVALERLRTLRDRLGSDFPLEVDGGVNKQTMQACADAGARLFVIGSAIFGQPDYASAVRELRTLAKP
jgi:ribulose-phosphate 3-epimerase